MVPEQGPLFSAGPKKESQDLRYFEEKLYQQGYRFIAGIDEVGRGSIAGPVAAAAVILPADFAAAGVNDSKKISPRQRLKLSRMIKKQALAWAVVMIAPGRVDQINIQNATIEAMTGAVKELKPVPDFLLIDMMKMKRITIHQHSLIKGDSRSVSIAAASILAKVERDQTMAVMETLYPGYGFHLHKGYATRQHVAALYKWGITPIHRHSFEPVKTLINPAEYNRQSSLF